MTAESTRERELAPLKAVQNNYEKVVLTMHTNSTISIDGRLDRSRLTNI